MLSFFSVFIHLYPTTAIGYYRNQGQVCVQFQLGVVSVVMTPVERAGLCFHRIDSCHSHSGPKSQPSGGRAQRRATRAKVLDVYAGSRVL